MSKSEKNQIKSGKTYESFVGKVAKFLPKMEKFTKQKNDTHFNSNYNEELESDDNLNYDDYDTEIYEKSQIPENFSKNPKTLVKLTSDELMNEYGKFVKYMKRNYFRVIIFSLLIIINGIISNIAIQFSSMNLTLIILSIILICFTIILYILLYLNLPLDTFGYVAFYFLGITHSAVLIVLFLLKVFTIFYEYTDMKHYGRCPRKQSVCFELFMYLFMYLLTFATLILMVFLIGYPIGFCIRVYRVTTGQEKSIAQKQIDINNTQFQKIEFADENANKDS